jgi:ABC-type transport system involved in multi-copper enzyme maturation permease subunit
MPPANAAAHRVPGMREVVGAITGRELRLASRRRLVLALFVLSLLPLVVFALVLIIGAASEATFGTHLDWDPVAKFLGVQAFPVELLALGLGTPIVAQDRAEDVLFLYATRPVRPAHYALGKLLAVALPCTALLLLPGFVMAGLRFGILTRVGLGDTLIVAASVVLASLLIGWGYAGVTLAASALTHRTRWAVWLALAVLILPDSVAAILHLGLAIGPGKAINAVIAMLFDHGEIGAGIWGASLLAALGMAGAGILLWRARREMTP